MPPMQLFHEQVERFKRWAASVDRRHGEWECEYENWNELRAASIAVVAKFHDGEVPAKVGDDLIYTLARDNECEYIRDYLIETPNLIATLAARVVSTNENDAKWQIAVLVAEANLENAADLLRPFLSDENEYVRRRSLLVFARFSPEEAEVIALNGLDDEFEYTRIAALHVLHLVESQYLTESLNRLASDSSQHVRHNVEELRVARTEA